MKIDNVMKPLQEALQERRDHNMGDLHCPKCDKPIRTSASAGIIGAIVNENREVPIKAMYALCRKCGRREPEGKVFKKIERRIDRNFRRYGFLPQALLPDATKLTANRVGGAYVQLTPDLSAEWIQNDREWFEAHPDRTTRLRKRYEDETDVPSGAPGLPTHVAVQQQKPGVRTRIGVFSRVFARDTETGEVSLVCDVIIPDEPDEDEAVLAWEMNALVLREGPEVSRDRMSQTLQHAKTIGGAN